MIEQDILVDQRWMIKFVDLEPFQKVTLHSSTTDERHINWASSIHYVADERGVLDLQDDMTPLTTMEPIQNHLPLFYKKSLAPLTIYLKLYSSQKLLSILQIKQHQCGKNVEIHSLTNDLVGKLFIPEGSGPFPGIIVLGGSSGGLHERRAALLASHGFAALALAYFKTEGLPERLENIPLEYFENSINFMNQHSKVRGVSLMGTSRGGELALLLGTLYPINKIIAYVPSAATYGGVPDETRPSWTLQGTPLPIAPFPSRAEIAQNIKQEAPISITPFFLKGMQDQNAFEKALIPVEKITADILLISGEEDAMWPSTHYCNLIMKRLENSSIKREHLSYPHAGHTIQPPYVPTTRSCTFHPVNDALYELGGTPEATAFANEDSWKKILAFLKSYKG